MYILEKSWSVDEGSDAWKMPTKEPMVATFMSQSREAVYEQVGYPTKA